MLSTHSRKTIKSLVDVRMRQQQRLTTDPALTLHALIHEPILRQGVNRAQLRKLLDSTELPNITIQIVPQTHVHQGLPGPLTLLSFDDNEEPDIAFHESLIGLQETQNTDRTRLVKQTLDHIAGIAMSPAESAGLLTSAIRQADSPSARAAATRP